MKRVILILLVINLISSVYAASLGISPSSIEFKSKANEKTCSKIILFTTYNSTLVGESRWAKSKAEEKDIRYYTLQPESLGLTLEYPQDVRVETKKEIEVCLTSEKEGEYYGALIYSIENKPAAVGTWIHASIQGKSQNKITGTFLIPETSNKPLMIFYLPTALLFIIFLLLLIIAKKKQNQREENFN